MLPEFVSEKVHKLTPKIFEEFAEMEESIEINRIWNIYFKKTYARNIS